MKKILFIAPHRKGRSPGQRFRFEQYMNYLQINGYTCDLSYLISESDDKYFYRKKHILRKLFIFIKCIFIRIKDVIKAKQYDIIFIYREALFTRSTIFEYLFSRRCKHVFFDFDDAIFLLDVSEANRSLRWLKSPAKINKIMRYADTTIVGNRYLYDYAVQYAKHVEIFPTTLDLNTIKIYPHLPQAKVCIGWIGSTTTIKHIRWALPILRAIYHQYGDRVYFKIIADVQLQADDLPIENVKWQQDTESQQLSSFDIGIMPLPDDQWSRGKCGFKGLQCMAYGVPVVMSPVGVNTQIIQDGVNGFLADTEQEWVEKISLLIENPDMRDRIGKEGRLTVEQKYSFQALKDIYLNYFNTACSHA